jgi:hypothetical protein
MFLGLQTWLSHPKTRMLTGPQSVAAKGIWTMASIKWEAIVTRGAEIVNEYDTGVTLRQLFYRLVAEGRLPNRQNAYKSLSSRTAKARREGELGPVS